MKGKFSTSSNMWHPGIESSSRCVLAVDLRFRRKPKACQPDGGLVQAHSAAALALLCAKTAQHRSRRLVGGWPSARRQGLVFNNAQDRRAGACFAELRGGSEGSSARCARNSHPGVHRVEPGWCGCACTPGVGRPGGVTVPGVGSAARERGARRYAVAARGVGRRAISVGRHRPEEVVP